MMFPEEDENIFERYLTELNTLLQKSPELEKKVYIINQEMEQSQIHNTNLSNLYNFIDNNHKTYNDFSELQNEIIRLKHDYPNNDKKLLKAEYNLIKFKSENIDFMTNWIKLCAAADTNHYDCGCDYE